MEVIRTKLNFFSASLSLQLPRFPGCASEKNPISNGKIGDKIGTRRSNGLCRSVGLGRHRLVAHSRDKSIVPEHDECQSSEADGQEQSKP